MGDFVDGHMLEKERGSEKGQRDDVRESKKYSQKRSPRGEQQYTDKGASKREVRAPFYLLPCFGSTHNICLPLRVRPSCICDP